MILYFDIGNTRLKCWLERDSRQSSSSLEYFVYEHQHNWLVVLSSLAADIGAACSQIKAIYVSNVAGEQAQMSLMQNSQKFWAVEPVFAKVTRQSCFIANSYKNLQQLGVDRWVAIHGVLELQAHKVRPPYVVVDCGTAITVDVVDENMKYVGGAILPGIDMARASLSQASGIGGEESGLLEMSLGQTTEDCCLSGVLASCVGGVEQMVSVAEKELGVSVSVVFTGGGSESLLSNIEFDYIYEPKLLFYGLKRLFKCD